MGSNSLRRVSVTSVTAVLCACTHMPSVETAQGMIGSPQSSVRDTLGAPTESHQLADGATRWIYSKQPTGYEVYAVDFDTNGKVINYRQMLTEKEIYEAMPGKWTMQDVVERFGRPRVPIEYYPLMKRQAWSYRMYAAANVRAQFVAYFDDHGVLDRTMIIPDLMGGNDRDSSRQ